MRVNDYEYPDICSIYRPTGDVSEQGEEVFETILSNTYCEIQYGGGGNTNLYAGSYKSSPALFMPICNIVFEINDKVVVTSLNGRVSNYTIGQFESLIDFNDTCIWLKDGTE